MNVSWWLLWMCWTRLLANSTKQSSVLEQLVNIFQEEIGLWEVDTVSPRTHLEKAFDAIQRLTPMLGAVDDAGEQHVPEDFSRMELALKIFEIYQTTDHLRYIVPLIESELYYKGPQNKFSLWDACFVDLDDMRRQCQDLFAILCYVLRIVGYSSKAEQCVRDYDANRLEGVQFQSPTHANRQLPGLRAIPVWWDSFVSAEPPFAFLGRIHAQFATIQNEILQLISREFSNWSPKLDLRLSTNADWNPQKAWDSIVLNSYGEWREGCNILPVVCGILKREENSLMPLLGIGPGGIEYLNLVGKDRVAQGYDEIPTLGIKLYRVLPQSGIKPHTGSSGRLVHSLTISAPRSPPATLTVAGDVYQWKEGHFLSFDDSFYHSVDNPHYEVPRIVLSFVTLHPDLVSVFERSAAADSEL